MVGNHKDMQLVEALDSDSLSVLDLISEIEDATDIMLVVIK